jgi:simple sugar transport system ATP-binding protein
MVHQHFMLINNLTVAENIVLGQETGTPLYFDRKQAIKNVEELCEQYNLMVDPTAKIEDITVGMQQRVEILKALYRGVDILILDEPTRGIDVGSKYEIYEIINHLVSMGKSVIFISSDMPELIGMCDRVFVLAEGYVVGELQKNDISQENIMKAIMEGAKK